MFTKERFDGAYISNLPLYEKIIPYIIPSRTNTCVVFEQKFDVTKTLEFAKERELPLVQIFIFAAVRAFAQMPKANRFVSGHRHYQRNRLSFNFPVKSSELLKDREYAEAYNGVYNNAHNEEDIDINMSFSVRLTFDGFCKKVKDYINAIDRKSKSKNPNNDKLFFIFNKLPRFLVKFLLGIMKYLDYHNALPVSLINSLPFYSTMIITNTDSLPFDATLYRNYEIGTCGIFCTIGAIKKEDSRDTIKIGFTYDDRITDAVYFERTIGIIRDLTENPEKLEEDFEMTTEQLVRLGLSDKELNNI